MAPRGSSSKSTTAKDVKAESYRHPESESPARPEAGTQAQFKKKKTPARYRYDSSLSPVMEWDGQNAVRELGEWLIACIQEASKLPAPQLFESAREFRLSDGHVAATVRGLGDAVEQLAALSKPFLNWTGKAERLSFDVPTLPLFVHERLSTAGIIETLKSHKTDPYVQNDLFGDPQRSIADQVLRSYEYKDKWVNRMVLGDSLVVMNSLLHYEGMGSQVQMIYMDPPYGVKFGSNFQPFVRKRDVSHNDDEDMTREPEMVKAYRDTWELGLHSYLTYMRDRLLLARELLTPSGSIFVQISDENLHHVRELMDEVFGAENFVSVITLRKTTSEGSTLIGVTCDFLIWYAKNKGSTKFRPIYVVRSDDADSRYDQVLLQDGIVRSATEDEREGIVALPVGAKLFQMGDITSSRPAGEGDVREFIFEGKTYTPGAGTFKTNATGLNKLIAARRCQPTAKGKLRYRRFKDDFGFTPVANLWADISGAVQSRSDPKIYVVQTSTASITRCILMTTDPGDLVLDPTCGSGTTAYVAEQWGRRWITIDTSRVPLALARQRILTATFPWYDLKEEERGPVGGFVYKRKQNNKGEEVGGIVPHVTLKSIANDEPPQEEVLVDRPEVSSGIVRVSGPFVVEATIPTPTEMEGEENAEAEGHDSFIARMIEVLRRSPILHLGGGKQVILKNIRPPAKSMSLSAEAFVEGLGTRDQGSGEKDGGEDIQRIDSMAEEHGARTGDIQGERSPAEGRTVRSPEPNAEVRSVRSEQYSGGQREENEGRVPSIPRPGQGFPGGTGNTDSPLPGSGVVGGSEGDTRSGRGDRQALERPHVLSSPQSLVPSPLLPVAIVFGPENGAVSERSVYEAAREAHAKNYSHLYVIGFAIQPNARKLVEECDGVMGVAATYVQATPDLMMGDLLKNMRSSQIFSVCGLPDVKITRVGIRDQGSGIRDQGSGNRD
jgi:adenine-specific DNA-methyltransferase